MTQFHTQLCLNQDVVLGDLTLNTIDEYGTTWVLLDLDGWWTLPEVDLPDEQRSFHEEGSYSYEGRYLARVVTLRGYFKPATSSAADLVRARNKLLAVCQATRTETTLVVREELIKQATVRISARPLIATGRTTGETAFEVTMRASDPRKYSTDIRVVSTGLAELTQNGRTYNREYPMLYGALSSTGYVTLENAGTATTPLVIEFTGQVTNPRVTNSETGEYFQINTSLSGAPGTSAIIDTGLHTASVNGVVQGTFIQTGSRYFNGSGASTILFFSAAAYDASALMTVRFRSAWYY